MKIIKITLIALAVMIIAAIFIPVEKVEAAYDFTIEYTGDKLILSDFKKNEISENVHHWSYDYSTVKEIVIKDSDLHYNISWFGAVHISNDLAYIISAMPNIEVFRFDNVLFRDDIGTSMSRFPAYAFQYNPKIREFYFTERYIGIGHYAFRGCPNLELVDINVRDKISDYAFEACPKLSQVTIHPKKATSIDIGTYAFANCTSLKNISIDQVNNVGWGAFEKCEALETVNFPTASSITDYAFYMCSNLKSANLPNATTVGSYAFQHDWNLRSVNIPKLQKVSYCTFENCQSLTTAYFPQATGVEAYAFKNCTVLTNVTLPNATYFHNEAFRSCLFLRTLELPAATSFEWSVFEDCDSLTNLLLGSVPPFAQSNAFNSTYPYRYIFVPSASKAAYDSAGYPDGDGLWNGFTINTIQTGNEITEVLFSEFDPYIYAYPEPGSDEIIAFVPYGTDWNRLKELRPLIRTSYMATVYPLSSTTHDFTLPVQYTVTSQSGTSRTYSVIIRETPNTENDIESFNFNSFNPDVTGVIDQDTNTISLTISYYEDITSIIPSITVSPDARISPASGAPRDFTNPIVYTVTAQNGDTKEYIITVIKEPDPMNGIKSFVLDDFNPDIIGTIDDPGQVIYITIPYGTDTGALSPSLQISEGAAVSPKSNTAQDFSAPVTYTVTSTDGISRSYTALLSAGDYTNSMLRLSSFASGRLGQSITLLHQNLTEIKHLTISGGQLNTADWNFITSSLRHLETLEIINEARLYSSYLSRDMFSSGYGRNYFSYLKTLRIHNISEIMYMCLYDYSSLEFFEAPQVISVLDKAFKYSGVKEVILPSAEYIGSYVFDYCSNLKSLSIPNIQYIDYNSFNGCTSFNQLFLGDSVPSIDSYAFYSVTANPRYVYVPSSSLQAYITYPDGNTADDLWLGWKITTPVEISAFSFEGFVPTAEGTIDKVTNTIRITVPYGTDTTSLIPTITLSGTAHLSPGNSVAQDFSAPAAYTVTDPNGIITAYTVVVNKALNTENKITSFLFNEFNPLVTGVINEASKTVVLTVPYGTDITNLTPLVAVSEEASINPPSGIIRDFTSPVIYMVTAQNGNTQDYAVTVESELNTEKKINSFSFNGMIPVVDGIIDEATKTIILTVPYETDVTALIPSIEISGDATIVPGNETAVDFTNPAIYTVSAQNVDTQEYSVTVTREKPGLTAQDFVWVSGWSIDENEVLARCLASSNAEVIVSDWGGLDANNPLQNNYTVTLLAGDTAAFTEMTITISVMDATGNGGYNIVPQDDSSFLFGVVDDVPTLTIIKKVKKMTLSVTVEISKVLGHTGTETIVFEHYKGKKLVASYVFTEDFDAGAVFTVDFDVKQKDIIKIYIIEEFIDTPGIIPAVL